MSESKINLFCAYGTLESVSRFGQALSTNGISCKNDGSNFRFTPTYCDSDSTDFGYTNTKRIDQVFNQTCYG